MRWIALALLTVGIATQGQTKPAEKPDFAGPNLAVSGSLQWNTVDDCPGWGANREGDRCIISIIFTDPAPNFSCVVVVPQEGEKQKTVKCSWDAPKKKEEKAPVK